MSGLTIRECVQGEVASVLELWREAEATTSVTDNVTDLRRAVASDSAFVLVAEADGRPVGSVIGAFDGWRGHIYRLAVHPSFRRQGIARSLVAAAEKRLAQQGVKRITALVEKDRLWATGFWDAVDYQRDPRMIRYVKNTSAGISA